MEQERLRLVESKVLEKEEIALAMGLFRALPSQPQPNGPLLGPRTLFTGAAQIPSCFSEYQIELVTWNAKTLIEHLERTSTKQVYADSNEWISAGPRYYGAERFS
jgi:hypothetical protein